MIDKLVEFETALLAYNKGFDWITSDDKWYAPTGELEVSFQGYQESLGFYRIASPTQSLLQRWLREAHKIHIIVNPTVTSYWTFALCNIGNESVNLSGEVVYDSRDFRVYEEALEEAFVKALNLIK